MKKIKFIRHSRLESPYSDYSQLTFNQVCGLATCKITPNISSESREILLEKFDKQQLRSFKIILCSYSNRTEQTAKLITKVTGKDHKFDKTNNLSEIFFDPAILINEEDFTKRGFTSIREALFHGMKTGKGAERLNEVLSRIKKLKAELLSLPYDNILCITHSFYMRVLRLYFLENLTESHQISESKLLDTIDHNYLEGFEIYL